MSKTNFLLKGNIVSFLILFNVTSAKVQTSQDSIWVAYDGKEQFLLKEAKRIPTGKLVTIIGKPIPKVLPRVFILNNESGKRVELEVTANRDKNAWVAGVPKLKPKTETKIIIDQFRPLRKEEVDYVKTVFEKLLLDVYSFSSAIPENALASEISTAIKNNLSNLNDPDTTLSQFSLLKDGKSTGKTLGSELIDLISDEVDRQILNQPNDWLNAINALKEIFTDVDESIEIPDNGIQRIKSYSSRIDVHLLSDNNDIRKMWIKKLVDPAARLVPMEMKTAGALKNYIKIKYSANEGLKSRLLEQVNILETPLEETYRKVFQAMRQIVRNSYSPEILDLPFFVSDLLRYGTVDFAQGYVATRLKEPRGFLIFSFYPSGPQERTPQDALSIWTISLGYSVTGGGEDSDNLFLAGATFRTTRFLSITIAGVTATEGKKNWNLFLGVSGDLTTIPFLDNLFTIQP